jgi:serine/threonine-protein kinase HipA
VIELDVLLGSDPVGVLSHDPEAGRYEFSYAPDWLRRDDRFALCPAMPLETGVATSIDEQSRQARQFFENLLPEGRALEAAAAAAGVARNDVAGLLAALGRETAGALRIRPRDVEELSGRPDRRLLTPAELSERIRARPTEPFSVWDGRVRVAVTGPQDQVAVCRDAEQWYLVEGAGLASTHVLKPEPTNPALAGLTTNEFFCMRLAAAVGIPAATVDLLHVPEPLLQVTRFDRRMLPGRVDRVQVIDGCQALGLPVSAKYERLFGSGRDVRRVGDGANLPRLFRMLSRASARPLFERRALLRWTMFQVLVGNPDAHAKTLSFHSGAEGLSLAPACDLISLHALESGQVHRSYAMAIGDASSSAELSPGEWSVFASRCGLPVPFVRKELAGLAERVRWAAASVAETAIAQGAPREVVDRIVAGTLQECERQQLIASKITKLHAA